MLLLVYRHMDYKRKMWKERWIVQFSKVFQSFYIFLGPINSVPGEHVSDSYFHINSDKGFLHSSLSTSASEQKHDSK